MGRDIIQLENAVSIISQEYLLEFTSEYGIPEGLHPELPGPEETIVDLSTGKVGVYTKFFEFANFRIPISQFLFDILGYYQIYLSQLYGSVQLYQCRESHQGKDWDSSSILRDTVHHGEVAARLSQRRPAPNNYRGGGAEEQVQDEVAYEIPLMGNALATWVALETGLEKEVAAMGQQKAPQERTTILRESATAPRERHCPIIDPGMATEILTEDAATAKVNIQFFVGSPESVRTSSVPFMVESPSGIYQPGWDLTNDCRLDAPDACQDFVDHIAPPRLRFEQEVLNLQAQVIGEEKIKVAFGEFKNYENDKVKQWCAEMDARLDKLSVDFDKELYPHMLTAIAGGHGLRLAIMKCVESSEIRQAFADVVSTKLAKGMSEGLKYCIEHGKAGLDLAGVESYDPESNNKLVKALQDLKDLNDTGKDAPQWIRDLRPSSSQLKIPVYPEVRDPEDLWVLKEEMLLEDAIAANISWVKKKKKRRVVCRTHGIGSAHYARSDGVPVSAPTVPQGLAILLADAATQTEASDQEKPHLRL
nr:transposase (putative), gypsy type [Tanacetum cinerariifolium]